MAFTYTENLSIPRDFVRFYTGDVIESQSFLSDEIIASLITAEGSQEAAVIAGLQYILTRLSQPDFRADWLEVDYATARTGYEQALVEMMRKFGVSSLVVDGVNTYRADSAATTPPDYSAGRR